MYKKVIITAVASLVAISAFSQGIKTYDTGRKWSAQLDRLVQGQSVKRLVGKTTKTFAPDSVINVLVTVEEAAPIEAYLKENGYEAETISDELLTAIVPARFVSTLAQQEGIRYINPSRQMRPLLANARTEMGVTDVLAGKELDTPYDGTGVVIGVIDQGFQYSHPAFTGRAVRYNTGKTSGTLTTKQPTDEKDDVGGHATHVTNIAGGSKVSTNNYYGIATGADLVLVTSDLDNTSVLKQAKAIKKYAEGEGKPWVVNMSFGAEIGPHDGSSEFDQAMDALTTSGGIMVAAMGNSAGNNYHAHYKFTKDNETAYLYVLPQDGSLTSDVYLEVWGMPTDGKYHLTIKPVIYYNNRIYEPSSEEISTSSFQSGQEIDEFNNRQHFFLYGSPSGLRAKAGAPTTATNYKMLLKIVGDAGDEFHAWCSSTSYAATFESLNLRTYGSAIEGDDDYLVGEGGASIPSAIAVASYNNTSLTFKSLDGNTYGYNESALGTAQGLSAFSSHGPQLNDSAKPAIVAPGGNIISALSKTSSGFDNSDASVTARVIDNAKVSYYGSKCGTSMATPMVTGIVALWLQANPQLTYNDILTIFKATGRKDSFTGTAGGGTWDAKWGYGKIDAYEGLKKALQMRTAIDEVTNSEAPVTFSKENREWKVLFNSNEGFADIRLHALDGKLIKNIHLNAPHAGEEYAVSLTDLTPGVYVFRVNTPNSQISRKLVVK